MLYQLELRSDFSLDPRYNIAPSQQVIACRISPQEAKRELVTLKWGLIPFWVEDPAIGNRMINARSETVAGKPSFREAFKKRRALIPTSGFYEWKKEQGGKQPYYICRKDGEPFSLAGLWELWQKGEEPLESCTIITTGANALVAPLHERMPVIISPEQYSYWLNPHSDPVALQELLQPSPPEEFVCYPVSRLVNSPANDSPELVLPLNQT
jgi:putative SOS response-associated peptidase YedK